jgi:hypothetical protein
MAKIGWICEKCKRNYDTVEAANSCENVHPTPADVKVVNCSFSNDRAFGESLKAAQAVPKFLTVTCGDRTVIYELKRYSDAVNSLEKSSEQPPLTSGD